MQYLLYGFETDIRKYELRYIFSWLLVVVVLHFIVGYFIARCQVRNSYMKLIRQGRFSRWWHLLCIRIFGLCLLSTGVAFVISQLSQMLSWGKDFGEALGTAPLQAFLLFLLNYCFLSTFQLMLINLEQGEKLSFLLPVVVEVVSLYGGLIREGWACWLPGSWKMYCRSSLFFPSGYPVAVTGVIQAAGIAVCGWLGYKLLEHN